MKDAVIAVRDVSRDVLCYDRDIEHEHIALALFIIFFVYSDVEFWEVCAGKCLFRERGEGRINGRSTYDILLVGALPMGVSVILLCYGGAGCEEKCERRKDHGAGYCHAFSR